MGCELQKCFITCCDDDSSLVRSGEMERSRLWDSPRVALMTVD